MSTLNPERWQAVNPYLDQALSMADEDRAAWLAALSEENPAIAADLQTLLEEHLRLREKGFLDRGPLIEEPESTLAGQTVGAYTLKSSLGRGGMGSVWLAERSDGRFERQAAIKFLNIALAGRGEARFRREGSILARLTHPHIAQLVDAGVSSAGQPYLVLEHVDGEPIDRYCDKHKLDVHARVTLFLDVLQAVAHAHANLIVHRDIKPSNVLVTANGQVKLLDFGIAKLLEDEAAVGVATRLTREGGGALTPEYAAPEQVAGGSVSVATDIYQLGVLLFELLTRTHPAATHLRSHADLIKAIVEIEPPRPSDVVTDARLRRALRGDLDTIVRKMLKKKPDERYPSVTALADDLRRHLRHQPISARPDAIAYRAAKFVRRNRVLVVATALTIVSLSAGVVIANRQRGIAQERFLQVRQLANRLFDIDVEVRQLAGGAKARQLIVDTSLEYLRRLGDAGDDPELALDLGTAYMRVARVQGIPISPNLGQADAAEQNLQIAERLMESVLSTQPNNRLALFRSAQIAHDRMILAGLRRPADQAIVFAQKSFERLERYLAGGAIHADEEDQVVIALMNVANRYVLEDRLDEGIGMARRTADIARSTNQPAQAGAAMMVVFAALRARGDLDEALSAVTEAVQTLEPSPNEKSTGRRLTYALALLRQGSVLGEANAISMGRREEAIASLEKAFNICEEFARQDPNDVSSRERLFTAGIRLAGILVSSDPRRALDIYDHMLRRTAEIKNNSRARRDEARTLAHSTYALRLVGRSGDVRGRLDRAFQNLSALKLYPAERVTLGSEPDDAVRALADHEAESGNVILAIQTYRQLLEKIMAGAPEPKTNLADANQLSRLYVSLADLERKAGASDRAATLAQQRLELWQHWAQTRPNAFVTRQLAASR